MGGPRYGDAEKEKFFDLIDRGGTVRAAAAGAGVHPDTGYRWMRNAGLAMRRSSPRIYSKGEKDTFFRVLAERGNVSAAARELGFTRVTCYKWGPPGGDLHQRGTASELPARGVPASAL